MSETDIAARLQALASDDKRRPETARLRDVFDDVERALKAGVPQAAVLAELHEAGFTMTIASFKSALQRIRKERSEAPPSPKVAAPIKAATAATQEALAASCDPPGGTVEPPGEPEDSAGLDKTQRREKRADQFIKPEGVNPLLKSLIKDKKS